VSAPHLSPRSAERRLYLLTTTRWLSVGFVVGIFILVQTGRGLTIAQAATVGSVMGLTCFFLELPTSGFADAVGRRPVYLAAAVINVVAIVGYALAQSFWAFVAAGVLMGAFRALDSGPLEAWFVDTVHETTPGSDVDRQLSRAGSILGGAIAVGAVLSGLLIWWNPVATVFGQDDVSALDLAVWVSAALTVVHLVTAWVVMQERRPTAGSERTRISHALSEARRTPAVIRSGLSLLGHNRVLMGIVAAEVFWSIGMITFESFMPLRLEELVGSAQEAGALVGPVSAAGWGLFSVGAWLAGLTSTRIGVARAHRGLPVHLLDARHERPAARRPAAPRGRGEEPLHRAVDQLDDGLPRLRRRRSAVRPDGRPGEPGHRDGDGRGDQHPRGVLLPACTARREGSQPAPSRG
jgi:MFS family permease